MSPLLAKPSPKDDLLQLPQCAEAESSAVGACLLDPSVLDDVFLIAPPETFLDVRYQKVLKACRRAQLSEKGYDQILVHEELVKDYDEPDALELIVRLLEAVPHSYHAKHYAEVVRKHHDLRQILIASRQAIHSCHDKSLTVSDVIAAARRSLDAIEDGAVGLAGPVAFKECLQDFAVSLTEPQSVRILSTGFEELDELLSGGLRPGQLAIVAGRPSAGKTAFAGAVVLHVVDAGFVVLFITLEQPRNELVERMVSSLSGVAHDSIRQATLDELEAYAINDAAARAENWKLFIDDTHGRTVSEIAAMARVQKRKYGLDILVIDYLQLLTPEDAKVIREQQVSAMSRGLKLLAKELNCPVLCLSQMSRAIEARDEKKPKLSDLRESGAIEQDADCVWFLSDGGNDDRERQLIVAKNRSGRKGSVTLGWRPETLRFTSKAAFSAVNDF